MNVKGRFCVCPSCSVALYNIQLTINCVAMMVTGRLRELGHAAKGSQEAGFVQPILQL